MGKRGHALRRLRSGLWRISAAPREVVEEMAARARLIEHHLDQLMLEAKRLRTGLLVGTVPELASRSH